MPYYIRSTKGCSGSQMLVEESAAYVKKAMRDNLDTHYSPVCGKEAHDWVRSGRIHGTGLFTDRVPTRNWPYYRDRIRKAQPGF